MAEQQLVSPFDFATAGSVYDSIDPPARFTESPMASPSMSCVEEGREGDDLFTLVTRKLSFLKFDSAKELCEKEEKASSQGSVWHTFSSILFHLAQAEKGYFSFSFLEKSWAFMPVKKEPQKGTVQYDLALHQLPLLKKLVDSERDSLESPTVEDFLTIARHLPYFVQTRGQLIEFYAALYSKGRTYIDSDQANKDLYSISQGIKKSLQPDYLVHLRNLLHKEVTLLQELLKTNSLIAQWDYLPSLLQLESIQARLLKWCGVNPLHTMGMVQCTS